MESLRQRTKESSNELRLMEQEQEAFAINYHECTKLNGIAFFMLHKYICLILNLGNIIIKLYYNFSSSSAFSNTTLKSTIERN